MGITRETENSRSCIDHAFIKNANNKLSFTSYIIKSHLTDHYPTVLHIHHKNIDGTYCNHRNLSETLQIVNYNKFYDILASIDWTPIYSQTDANSVCDTIVERVRTSIAQATRSITINNRAYTKNLKPWITAGLITSIRLSYAKNYSNTHIMKR